MFFGPARHDPWAANLVQISGQRNYFWDFFSQPHVFYTVCALIIMILAIVDSFYKSSPRRAITVRPRNVTVSSPAGDGKSKMQMQAKETEALMRRVDECRRTLERIEAAERNMGPGVATTKSWTAETSATQIQARRKVMVHHMRRLARIRRHYIKRNPKNCVEKHQLYKARRSPFLVGAGPSSSISREIPTVSSSDSRTDEDGDSDTIVQEKKECCIGSSSVDTLAPNPSPATLRILERPFKHLEDPSNAFYYISEFP